MKQKGVLNVIVLSAIVYFIWLFIVALNEVLNGTKLLVELRLWALIGVVVYAVFLVLEIIMYVMAGPSEPEREYKLVEEVPARVVCSNCKTVFTIMDPGTRPLAYTCPHCGEDGALRGKKIEGIATVLTCRECDLTFEIMDTGERPIEFICPHCQCEGVVQACSGFE
jgi:Zn finger protein HypA/HybF involved in hydrogenase expression